MFNTGTNGLGMLADLALPGQGSGGHGGGVGKRMARMGDGRIVEARGAAKNGEVYCGAMSVQHV